MFEVDKALSLTDSPILQDFMGGQQGWVMCCRHIPVANTELCTCSLGLLCLIPVSSLCLLYCDILCTYTAGTLICAILGASKTEI